MPVLTQRPGWGFGIRMNNTLWAWGDNFRGELGLADVTFRSSPVQVGSLLDWAMASAGGSSSSSGTGVSLAVKTDGTLWAIGGRNLNGDLGLGDTVDRSSPCQIGSDTDWAMVCAGNGAVAIKTTGTLWTWGNNANGQLGLGDITKRSTPTQVGTSNDWSKAYITRSGMVCAIKTDGTLWAWGARIGGSTSYSSPAQVGSASNWAYIAPSGGSLSGFVLAVTTGGALYAWGANQIGQLGLADVTYRSSLVQVGSATDWKYVNAIGDASNNGVSLALKTNGTLWSWGYNAIGLLGLGDLISRSSPCQIGSGTNWSSLGRPFSAGSRQLFAIQTP
jgi:alpha-tubulin suppressor-like RCC1 family protein